MNNLNKKSAFGAGGGSVFTLVGLGVILWFGRPFFSPPCLCIYHDGAGAVSYIEMVGKQAI